MRLERTDHAPVAHQAHRAQKRMQLRRVVGIVVIHVCAVIPTLEFQTPACAVEFVQRPLHCLRRNRELPADRARGKRVHCVVPSDDAELQMAIGLAAADNVKAAVVFTEICSIDVVRLCHAEAHKRKPLQRVHGVFVVAVCDDQAIGGHQFGKAAERMLHILQILEKVQMVRVNVQHDCRRGEEIQKRVAVFAALKNDRVALTHAVPRAKQRKRAADHDRGVFARFHENLREHGGCRGLAVRAGDADGVAVRLHDIAPCLCALKNRNAGCAGSGNFGVIIVGSGSADDAVRTLNIFCPVPDRNGNALCHQFVGRNRGVHIRTGNLHAHAAQHQPQRAHGNAADADQVRVSAGL